MSNISVFGKTWGVFDEKQGKTQEEINAEIESIATSAYLTDTVSGPIASFPDGAEDVPVKDITVAITPIQDLHGYDNPWPAGGGKNLLTALPSPGTTVWFCEPDGFLFKANQTYCFSIGDGVTVGSYSIYAADKTTQLVYATSNRKVRYTPTVDTVGYPRLYAGDGVTQEAINSAQLELGDSRTTFVPYSNICPITGWTECDIYHRGKNLHPPYNNYHSENSIALVKGGQTYTISGYKGEGNTHQYNLGYLKADGTWVGAGGFISSSATSAHTTVTVADDVVGINVYDTISPYTAIDTQVELGNEYTDFEAYTGTTYSIEFPSEAGTVYGGTLDVTTGLLTVYHDIVDLGTLTWTKGTTSDSGTHRCIAPLSGVKKADSASSYPNIVCSSYKTTSPNKTYLMTEIGITVSNSAEQLQLYDPSFADFTGQQVGTALDGVQLVYELATPVTYQLTPIEVKTLLGYNNIWADTGDITELIYRALRNFSTLLAPTEAGFKATRAYVANDLFIVRNALYKATINIASGATLTPNTNCVVTTVDDELGRRALASTTVNGKALSSNVTLTAEDITYDGSEQNHTPGSVGAALATQSEKIDELEIFAENAYVVDTATASIASFPDGADNVPVKDLTVNIDPVQDLHGYDNPWPAGGGVSKCPTFADGTHTLTNGLTMTVKDGKITISGTPSGEGLYEETIPTTVMPNDCYVSMNNPNTTSNLVLVFINASTQVSTAGFGSVDRTISPTGLSGATVNKLRIYSNGNGTYSDFEFSPIIHTGSTPQSYAPYSNICPITGWTGANVKRTGVNVWDEQWELGTFNSSYQWVSGGYVGAKNPVKVKGGETYYSKCTANVKYIFYDASGAFVSEADVPTNSTFTAPATADTMRFRTYAAYGSTYNNDISINYPSTDTDYHAYSGTVIPITFPTEAGTVYGGTLDVTTGLLTVDKASVDLGTLSWTPGTTSDHERAGSEGVKTVIKKVSVNSDVGNIVCSQYKTATASQTYTHAYANIIGVDTNGAVWIYDPSLISSTKAEFESAMSGVQLVYELATPVTYQLTPIEVKTLLGQNNIWADTGNSTAQYRADTKKYIEKLTAPTEDDMVANNSIAANKYFMVGNKLYYSTTSIAAGATLTVGTNCQEFNLAAALNALNS